LKALNFFFALVAAQDPNFYLKADFRIGNDFSVVSLILLSLFYTYKLSPFHCVIFAIIYVLLPVSSVN